MTSYHTRLFILFTFCGIFFCSAEMMGQKKYPTPPDRIRFYHEKGSIFLQDFYMQVKEFISIHEDEQFDYLESFVSSVDKNAGLFIDFNPDNLHPQQAIQARDYMLAFNLMCKQKYRGKPVDFQLTGFKYGDLFYTDDEVSVIMSVDYTLTFLVDKKKILSRPVTAVVRFPSKVNPANIVLTQLNAPVLPKPNKKLTGKVTSESGAPILRATILIKESGKIVTTDIDGKFTLDGLTTGSKLRISYNGYVDQEVTYTGQQNLSIRLVKQPQQNKLTATVVDADGKPVVGADILIKGTKTRTVTNLNGIFTLEGLKNGDKITIRYTGATTQESEFTYTGQERVKVVMDKVRVAKASSNGILTGKIIDNKGKEVIGAAIWIKEKGTSQGTVSDLDGNFELTKLKNGDKIVISYIGCIQEEIIYTGQSNVSIKMREDKKKRKR